MKRIVLIATAVAGIFTAGITTVAAAASTHSTTHKTVLKHETETVVTRPSCTFGVTTVPPKGSAAVTPGTASGYQYGATRCSHLQAGATAISFDTYASGEIVGKIQHWFRGGTLYGTFSLTQAANNGPPSPTSFTSSTYAGTVKITGGQGSLYGATGTGTLRCTTPDGVHDTCTEHLKVTQTVTVIKKVTVTTHTHTHTHAG